MWSLEMLSLFERKILKASERLISWWTSMKKVICKNIKKEINTLLFNYFFFFFFFLSKELLQDGIITIV